MQQSEAWEMRKRVADEAEGGGSIQTELEAKTRHACCTTDVMVHK